MRRMLVAGVTLAVVAAGVAVAARSTTSIADDTGLPFYSSPDLTPGWSGSTHRVAPFSLMTQTGAALTSANLEGRVHVASFIYPRCSSICPALVGSLLRVQSAIDDPRFRIVSYSVTPDLDTPEILAAFGRERGVNPERWSLVTGDKTTIYRLARDSYFANDERLRGQATGTDGFLHTEKLVLVDPEGRLRGVYNGTLPSDVDHLIDDARALVARLSASSTSLRTLPSFSRGLRSRPFVPSRSSST